MKKCNPVLQVFGAICIAFSAEAQGTFANLGFESANLSPIPAGQYGGDVSSLDGIPSWTGFLGTNQVTQVLHNDLTLGNASIDILGPDWSFGNSGGIIEGQYTVVLQPGFGPFGSGQDVSASISQTGLVPGDAQSLQFKAQTFGGFSVNLGGQDLSLIPLGTGANYTLYGANIPLSFAGQSEALSITALAGLNTFDYFDSIVFSSQPIPEPREFALASLGALLTGSRCWRRRTESPRWRAAA